MSSGLDRRESVGSEAETINDDSKNDSKADEHDYFNSDLYNVKLRRRVLSDSQCHLHSEHVKLPANDVTQPDVVNRIDLLPQTGSLNLDARSGLVLPNSTTAGIQAKSNDCGEMLNSDLEAKSTVKTMILKKNDRGKNHSRSMVNSRGRGRGGGAERGGA